MRSNCSQGFGQGDVDVGARDASAERSVRRSGRPRMPPPSRHSTRTERVGDDGRESSAPSRGVAGRRVSIGGMRTDSRFSSTSFGAAGEASIGKGATDSTGPGAGGSSTVVSTSSRADGVFSSTTGSTCSIAGVVSSGESFSTGEMNSATGGELSSTSLTTSGASLRVAVDSGEAAGGANSTGVDVAAATGSVATSGGASTESISAGSETKSPASQVVKRVSFVGFSTLRFSTSSTPGASAPGASTTGTNTSSLVFCSSESGGDGG